MSDGIGRREFVRTSAAVAAGLAFVKPERVFGNDLVGVGIIGAGGRGSYIGGEFLKSGGARIVAAFHHCHH